MERVRHVDAGELSSPYCVAGPAGGQAVMGEGVLDGLPQGYGFWRGQEWN